MSPRPTKPRVIPETFESLVNELLDQFVKTVNDPRFRAAFAYDFLSVEPKLGPIFGELEKMLDFYDDRRESGLPDLPPPDPRRHMIIRHFGRQRRPTRPIQKEAK